MADLVTIDTHPLATLTGNEIGLPTTAVSPRLLLCRPLIGTTPLLLLRFPPPIRMFDRPTNVSRLSTIGKSAIYKSLLYTFLPSWWYPQLRPSYSVGTTSPAYVCFSCQSRGAIRRSCRTRLIRAGR